jgi:opacity protein-like surface antigen
MKKNIKACMVAMLVGTAAFASSAVQAQSMEVYGGGGTEGVGAGLGYSFNQYTNVRAEVDGFSLSHNFTAGDLHYDAKVNLIHGALLGDFFPAPSVFPIRLTAGILVGGDNVDGSATSMGGTYTINGVTVPSDGESINAKLRFPTVRPYVGLGLGHNPNKKGLSVAFDAGVAFGKPRVSFDVPANIVAAAGQSNVNAEEQSLQAKANDLKFYPIVKVALTYRF